MLQEINKQQPNDIFIQRLLSVSKVDLHGLENSEFTRINLTEREQEVLMLTAEGLKREEIAKQLYITPSTVPPLKHISRMFIKNWL